MTRAPIVVKVGGNELDEPGWLRQLASEVARVPAVVVVHGGGKGITELQRALGVEPAWQDGLRHTGPAAMRAVSMVLSGVVNKRIVAALLDAGRDALGLSGEDGALLRARPRRGGALGRVGEVVEVRATLLRRLLAMGLVPVISPVSRGEDGGPLNVNADDAAAAVAGVLGAGELLLVTDVPRVMRGAQALDRIGVEEVELLIGSGVASGGMAPKLRAALDALARGAGAVRIGDLSMLRDPAAGTRIEAVAQRSAVA